MFIFFLLILVFFIVFKDVLVVKLEVVWFFEVNFFFIILVFVFIYLLFVFIIFLKLKFVNIFFGI